MNACLIYNNDLDGLYSAKLMLKSKYHISDSIPVDYGKDYSYLINKYDKFIFVDFSENFAEDRTELFIDHHIRNFKSYGAKKEIVEQSPSCLNVIIKNKIVESESISESYLKAINIVDSADYRNTKLNAIDVIFPDLNTDLSKFILLNDLLRKNRKTNLSLKLLTNETFDVSSMLYQIEKSKYCKIKRKNYMENKMMFYDKLESKINSYCVDISGVPVLFTRHFSIKDWGGWDRNIFNFLKLNSPFTAIVFEMNNLINVQIQKNPFCKKVIEESLYKKVKHLVKDPRGHENILMLTFKDSIESMTALNDIINTISENIL